MEYNQQLFSLVVDKFRAGENKAKIIESLTKDGWPQEEIEETIVQIRRVALRRMPIISSVLNFIDGLEEKHSDISTKAQVGLITALVAILLLVAVAMYFFFDLNQTVAPDTAPVIKQAPVEMQPEEGETPQ